MGEHDEECGLDYLLNDVDAEQKTPSSPDFPERLLIALGFLWLCASLLEKQSRF